MIDNNCFLSITTSSDKVINITPSPFHPNDAPLPTRIAVAAVVAARSIVVVPAAAVQQKARILWGLRDQPFEDGAMEGPWRQRLVVVVLPPPPPPTGRRRRDRCQPATKTPPRRRRRRRRDLCRRLRDLRRHLRDPRRHHVLEVLMISPPPP